MVPSPLDEDIARDDGAATAIAVVCNRIVQLPDRPRFLLAAAKITKRVTRASPTASLPSRAFKNVLQQPPP